MCNEATGFVFLSTRVEMIARKQLNTALFGPEHPFGRYAVAEDYAKLIERLGRKEAITRRFFMVFEYQSYNNNKNPKESEVFPANTPFVVI